MPPDQTTTNTPSDDPGAPAIDEAFDNLDDDLNPLDGKTDTTEGKESNETEPEDTETTADSPGEDTAAKTDDTAGEDEDDKATKKEDEDEDAGYSIDESEEDTDSQEELPTDKPAEAAPPATEEQQYIIDGVKDYAITVRGTVGKSEEVKEFKVLAPEQLPQGFQYIDGREQAIAAKSFGMLEQRAAGLQTQFQQQQQAKQTADFAAREQTADRRDIASLQKRGDIPLFKAAPNSADFEKDTGVELVQKVLDYKEQRNQRYMDEYNAGRPYKHIGFEEAFELYQKENPTKSNPAQIKEDKERKALAQRTSRANGSSSNKQTKATMHSGMTDRELDAYIESLEI